MKKLGKLLLSILLLVTLSACHKEEPDAPVIPDKYTITYYDLNMDPFNEIEVEEGNYVIDVNAPEVENYEFVGWQCNGELVTEIYVKENTTIVAVYQEMEVEKPKYEIIPDLEFISINVNEKAQLTWHIMPEGYDGKITIYCSDPSVLEVDDTGSIIGLNPGNVNVIVEIENSAAFIQVEVVDNEEEANSVVFKLLNSEKVYVTEGQPHQILLEATDKDGQPISVYYSSDDINIATVDQNGLVVANRPGHTVIRCSSYDGNYNIMVFIYNSGYELEAELADSIRTYKIGDYVPLYLNYLIVNTDSATTVNGLNYKDCIMVIDEGPEAIEFSKGCLTVNDDIKAEIKFHFEINGTKSNVLTIKINQ